jgi:hypothetical protein
VKGSEKTLGALSGMQKGLKETASVSLEAKAAIVGAMYALEQLFAASNQAGNNLTNTNAVFNTNIQSLQRYRFAARQVGASNEAMSATFKGLQDTATKTLLGMNKISGMARVSGITNTDINPLLKAATEGHPEALIQKLQEYAQKEQNAGLRHQVLSSFGIADDIQAAMMRNAFRPEMLAKAPTYSDKEVSALDQSAIKWKNLGTQIEMAVGHFNAKHGGEIVDNIQKIVSSVEKLAESFVKFAEKVKFFDKLNMIFQGWKLIFDGISDVIDEINEMSDDFNQSQKESKEKGNITVDEYIDHEKGKGKSTKDRLIDVLTTSGMNGDSLISILFDLAKEIAAHPPKQPPVKPGEANQKIPSVYSGSVTPPKLRAVKPEAVAPTMKEGQGAKSTKVEVNQSFNFNGNGDNHAEVSKAARKGIDTADIAARQLFSQGQAV